MDQQELSLLENQLQNFLIQRQSLQVEINEIENALSEIKKSDEEVYKIISGIMIKAEKRVLEKELKEKKELIELKISSIEKQEKIVEKNLSDLTKKISSEK